MNVKRTPFQLFFVIAAFCLGFAVVMLLFYDQILGNSLSPVLTAPGRTQSFSETVFTAIGGRWVTFAAFASASLFFYQHGLTIRNATRRDEPTPLGLPDQDLTARLQLALDYTAADVRANRAGLLSTHQAEQYGALQASTDQTLFNIGARAFIVIGGAVFVFWTTKAGLSLIETATTDTGRLLENIGAGILPLILIGLVIFRMARANGAPPKVKVVMGTVRLSMWDVGGNKDGDTTSLYRMWVQRKRFFLTEKQIKGFWNNGVYRVYFLQSASIPFPKILSAEIIRKP